MVLALPRGGVPVGYEVARLLGAPLEVFIVRKIGLPCCREVAMGALASGGIQVLDGDLIRRFHVQPYTVDMGIKKEMRELARREERYGAGSAPPVLRGRTAILVDDGLAAGLTMRAAVRAARNSNRHGSSSLSRSVRARRSACWKRTLTNGVSSHAGTICCRGYLTRSSARQQTRKFASCWDERVSAIASQAESRTGTQREGDVT